MAHLTPRQAELVGRIRDAFATLGLLQTQARHGSPGTAADLAAMAPVVGKFAAARGTAFVAKLRKLSSTEERASFIARAAEAAVRANGPAAKAAKAVNILGAGFMAYRAAKKDTDKLSALVGVVENVTAALSR